jgi:hypothetical protein
LGFLASIDFEKWLRGGPLDFSLKIWFFHVMEKIMNNKLLVEYFEGKMLLNKKKIYKRWVEK